MAFSTIQGSGGAPDSFVGTSGVDVVLIQNNPGPVIATGLGGADTIQFQEFTELVSGYTLKGGQGNDTFTALGAGFGTNMSNSFVNGNTGDDLIDLALVSGSSIFGGQGADRFLIDLNNSVLNGNAGIDNINVFSAAASTVYGGQGADVLNIGFRALGETALISSGDIRGDLGNDAINIDDASLINSTVNGSDGEDTILVTGVFSSTSSTIYGGQGDDRLDASAAAAGSTGVTLSGDAGNDTIAGTAFADNLFGGDGNDSITGGLLADTMTGGAGVNTFVIAAAATVSGTLTGLATGVIDAITDFKVGVTTAGVTTGDVISGGAFNAGALAFGGGFTTYAAAALAADAAGGNFLAAVGTGTSFTAYLFNGGALGGADLSAAVQLNGTGQYGSVALAQAAIVAGQIIA